MKLIGRAEATRLWSMKRIFYSKKKKHREDKLTKAVYCME